VRLARVVRALRALAGDGRPRVEAHSTQIPSSPALPARFVQSPRGPVTFPRARRHARRRIAIRFGVSDCSKCARRTAPVARAPRPDQVGLGSTRTRRQLEKKKIPSKVLSGQTKSRTS
jgi:hypothetical protein